MKTIRMLSIHALVLLLLLTFQAGCVVREVVVTSTPGATDPQTPATSATPTSPPATADDPDTGDSQEEHIYQLGITSDLTTTNNWAILGPDGTVWNQYALNGTKPALYSLSDQRFDWIPSLAADFPSPLQEETAGDSTFWSTEVKLRQGVKWSDGNDVTADDFVFTAQTAKELQLTGNWPSIVDPEFYDHSEAVDPHTLKIYFSKKPGLARWQFGLAFMPIFPKAYWEPVVAEAKQAGDITEQQKVLYAHVPDGEPSAGGFVFDRWEQGAFAEKDRDDGFYFSGSVIT